MAKKITLRHIATHLGVAISTVSKALKDSDEISAETKKRILAYVEEVHYTPNRLAVNLQKQRTMTIGVIVPELVHHFFTKVISGVENRASQYGYHIVISLSKDNWETERQITEMLSNGYIDGLLVSLAKETAEKADFRHFTNLMSRKFPLVFFDRFPPGIPVDKVIIDDVEGGYQATRHLIAKDARRIAILTTPKHISVGFDRERGYRKALAEAGISIDESLIIRIDERQSIPAQIARLFSQKAYYPDAVFAVNEQYASLALKQAKLLDLRVPEDLKLVGFTDGVISKAMSPSLTTIAQHGFEMGERAMEILMDRIENKDMFDKQIISIIPTNLIEREST